MLTRATALACLDRPDNTGDDSAIPMTWGSSRMTLSLPAELTFKIDTNGEFLKLNEARGVSKTILPLCKVRVGPFLRLRVLTPQIRG